MDFVRESHLLNFSEVKQIVLGSQISLNRRAMVVKGVKVYLGCKARPKGRQGATTFYFLARRRS